MSNYHTDFSKEDPIFERLRALDPAELKEIRLLVDKAASRTPHFTVNEDGRIRRFGRGGQHIGNTTTIGAALQIIEEQAVNSIAPVAPVAPAPSVDATAPGRTTVHVKPALQTVARIDDESPAPMSLVKAGSLTAPHQPSNPNDPVAGLAAPTAAATEIAIAVEPTATEVTNGDGEPHVAKIPCDIVAPAASPTPDVPVAPKRKNASTATHADELPGSTTATIVDAESSQAAPSESSANAPVAPYAPVPPSAPTLSPKAGTSADPGRATHRNGAVAVPAAPVAPMSRRGLQHMGVLVASVVLSAGTIVVVILGHRGQENTPVLVTPHTATLPAVPKLPEPEITMTRSTPTLPTKTVSRGAETIAAWLAHTLLGSPRPGPFVGDEDVSLTTAESALTSDVRQLFTIIRVTEQNRDGVLPQAWRAASATSVRLKSVGTEGLMISIGAANPSALITTIAAFLAGQSRFENHGIQIEVNGQTFDGPFIRFTHASLTGIARQTPGGVEINLTFR